jgi:hypothetical protein
MAAREARNICRFYNVAGADAARVARTARSTVGKSDGRRAARRLQFRRSMWAWLQVLPMVLACMFDAPMGASVFKRAVIITDLPAMVDRLARIVGEIDQPECAGHRLWVVRVPGSASELARKLAELSDHNRRWPPGVLIVKIIPDDPDHALIVVGNEAGYRRILQTF